MWFEEWGHIVFTLDQEREKKHKFVAFSSRGTDNPKEYVTLNIEDTHFNG